MRVLRSARTRTQASGHETTGSWTGIYPASSQYCQPVTSQNRKPKLPDRDTALSSWWSGSLGSGLLAAESELLGEALEDVFGWELLQVGARGKGRELLGSSRTRRQTVVATLGLGTGADVIGRAAQLPVTSDSMDAVLLPHTLEFASDPYAIVREVDRVLTGEGQLLVLGFAPWSPWGLRARFSRVGFPPGMRRVLSEKRIHDWLVAARIRGRRFTTLPVRKSMGLGFGRPTRGTGRYLRRGFNPFPAGAYLLKARQAHLHAHSDTAALPRKACRHRGSRQTDYTFAFFVSQVDIYTDGACRGNPGPGRLGGTLARRWTRERNLGPASHTPPTIAWSCSRPSAVSRR